MKKKMYEIVNLVVVFSEKIFLCYHVSIKAVNLPL